MSFILHILPLIYPIFTCLVLVPDPYSEYGSGSTTLVPTYLLCILIYDVVGTCGEMNTNSFIPTLRHISHVTTVIVLYILK